jgi:hypothetical protein
MPASGAVVSIRSSAASMHIDRRQPDDGPMTASWMPLQ